MEEKAAKSYARLYKAGRIKMDDIPENIIKILERTNPELFE